MNLDIGLVQDWVLSAPRRYIDRYVRFERRRAFNSKTRINFYQMVGGQLIQGVSLMKVMRGQYAAHSRRGKKPEDRVALVMQEIIAGIRDDGSPIAPVLAPWVTPAEVAIIAAAEAAGGEERAKAFDRCAEMLARRDQIVSAAAKPLRYSGALGLAFLGSLIGLTVFWLPEVKTQRPRALMPDSTGALFDLCTWLSSWWPIALVLVGAAITGLLWSLKNTVRGGKVGKIISKMPPFNIYEVYQSANFGDIMASMLGGGVKERDALALLNKYAGKWESARISKMEHMILIEGRKLGVALLDNPYEFPEFTTAHFMAELLGMPKFQEKMNEFAARQLKTHVERIQGAATTASYVFMALMSAWLIFVMNATLYAMASTFTM